mgnify:CR=1 FL=1
MTKIGLISDTHGYLDEAVFEHFKYCDEIWHAGDIGSMQVVEWMEEYKKPIRGVYGNIDDTKIRNRFPELLVFECEQVKVMMKHIGGYPGRYAPGVKNEMLLHKPALFISGHSHILKIMYDESLGCLHINPGAAGKQGWHQVRTIVKFVIDKDDIKDCAIIELGKR